MASDHDRNRRLARTADESVYVRYVLRREYHDDDPAVQRQLRPRVSQARPMHWGTWLLVGIVLAATLAGTVTFLTTGDDEQALGRVLLGALGGAVVGWLVVTALARLGAFRRTDDLWRD